MHSPTTERMEWPVQIFPPPPAFQVKTNKIKPISTVGIFCQKYFETILVAQNSL